MDTRKAGFLKQSAGLIVANKPKGITSRRVVDLIQRLCKPVKAGHAGTLDPLATGVLVVCIGAATRLIKYIQQMPKCYTAVFLLGRRSPSYDIETEVTELSDVPVPDHEQILAVTRRFVGCIQQRPPVFSALKIAGSPAYKLARKGKPVELAARSVEISRIEIIKYDYPELTLEIECGSGTYIRSLGHDLAESLGTDAVMSGLCRTRIGQFIINDAVDPQTLCAENWTTFLQPAVKAVEYLPQVTLSTEDIISVRNGRTIEIKQYFDGPEIAAVDLQGNLIGILTQTAATCWQPVLNLPI